MISPQVLRQVTDELRAERRPADAMDILPRVAGRSANGREETYLSLGGGRFVHVTAQGWLVTRDCPVPIACTAESRVMPEPVRDGSVAALRDLLPVTDKDFWLILAWLLACLRPGYPVPLLALMGPQGSGKSTAANLLKSIVDPGPALPASAFNADDVLIRTLGQWVSGNDNISGISSRDSDQICAAITGTSYQRRRLYTNTGIQVQNIQRPMIVTGLRPEFPKRDLISRCIAIQHQPIGKRRTISSLNAGRDEMRAKALGFLLDALSHALAALPATAAAPQRMADFVTLAEAAAGVMPWGPGEFSEYYTRQESRTFGLLKKCDPIVELIVRFTSGKGSWRGTATDLRESLLTSDTELDWLPQPNHLSRAIRSMEDDLLASGVRVGRQRQFNTGSRVLTLAMIDGPIQPFNSEDYEDAA